MTYKIKGDRRAEAHPAAEAFPLPEDSAIQTLAENIQRNGLLTTVLLQRIGGRDLVVDGRCRLRVRTGRLHAECAVHQSGRGSDRGHRLDESVPAAPVPLPWRQLD